MTNAPGQAFASAIESPMGRLLVQCLCMGAAAGILYARIGGVETQVTDVQSTQGEQRKTQQEQGRQLDRLTGKFDDVLMSNVQRNTDNISELAKRVRELELEKAAKR